MNNYFLNFCDNFIFYTHIIFLLFLFIVLILVSIPYFFCKILIVMEVVKHSSFKGG